MIQQGWKSFTQGLVAGVLSALLFGVGFLFILNMTDVIVLTLPAIPNIHQVMVWIYDNLRLSVIPFSLTLLLYGYALWRLNRHLLHPDSSLEKVAQAEQLVDIWINLFIGIGVIWTAIGIRSALLSALSDLDPLTAAEMGAFSILQRLVQGGILLALSTTIFGAVGGYVLRMIKAFVIGARLQAYYGAFAKSQNDEIGRTLHSIERHLAELVHNRKDRSEQST